MPLPPPIPITTEPAPILPEVGDCHLYDWYHSHDHDHVHEHHGLSMEQDLFYHYDADRDCRISKVEFYSSVGGLDLFDFEDFDSNGDAVLNYAEFFAFTQSELPKIEDYDYDQGPALSHFQLADADKDGYVSVDEAWLSFGTADINAEEYFTAFKLEMEGCDANDDHVLDEYEFEHFWTMDPICDMTLLFRYIFDLVDTDDNENVSGAELNSALMAYGEGLSEVELQKVMDAFDMNGDGSWNYGEYVGWANATRYQSVTGNIEYDSGDEHEHDHDPLGTIDEEFNQIDSNGDGFVSAPEFWEVYGYGDLETGINLIKSDWAGCDSNGDEKLNAKEFENYWNLECPLDYENGDNPDDEHEYELDSEETDNEGEAEVEDDSSHAVKTFKKLDADEDGFVSASEIFEDMGFEDLDGEEQIKLIKLEWKKEGCDENGDELLNQAEFVNYWNYECPASDSYANLSPFELADSDGDGYVTLSEAWLRFGSPSNNAEAHYAVFKLELEGCDLNDDEVLNKEEFELLWNSDPVCDKDPLHRYMFGLMDTNHDENVTKIELNSALSAYGGEAMSEVELQKEMGEFDADGEGTWNYEEYLGWLNARRYVSVNETVDNAVGGNVESDNQVGDEDVPEGFKEVDTDGNGFVSPYEFFVYKGFGDWEDEEKIEIELNQIKSEWKEEGCDENGDEMLDVQEIVNFWNHECPSSNGHDYGFKRADSDGDGFVSPKEYFVDMGYDEWEWDEKEIDNQIIKIKMEWKEEGCDENSDGLLSEEEFDNYWSYQCPLSHKNGDTDDGGADDPVLIVDYNSDSEIFKEVDADEDGFVSAHEILVDLGFDSFEDEEEYKFEINNIKSEWKEEGCDENGDDLLNIEEFGNYWNFQCPLSNDYEGYEYEDDSEDTIAFPK